MFAFATSLAIQSFTLLAVSALGDTAEAWRTVAIVYAIIGLIVNTLSVFFRQGAAGGRVCRYHG
jgi:GPH family glycoside/pentoside/hexuronide:cation symporter